MRTLVLISILAILASCSRKNNQDEFESAICQCVYDKYDSVGIDLKKELLLFEKHLVDNEFLIDTTGHGYIQAYKVIAKEDDIPVVADYTINGLIPQDFVHYRKCFYSLKGDSALKRSESKVQELYRIFDTTTVFEDSLLSRISLGLLKVLDADDFEKDFYKMYALHTFYFTANSAAELNNYASGPVINMFLTADQKIYIDSLLVPLDRVASKIRRIKLGFSEEELANCTVRLNIDKDTKMGLVADVKEQLMMEPDHNANDR